MREATLPMLDGKPTINPGPWLTSLVGTLLLTMGGLVAARSGLVAVPVSPTLLEWLCYGLAAIFLIRAVGDFNLIGFFKRVRDSRFSRWDSLAYSPLCLCLSAGMFQTGRIGPV